MSVEPTTGVWFPEERGTYFLACAPDFAAVLVRQAREAGDAHPFPLYVLLAVNDLNPGSAHDMAVLEGVLESGARVLLDSGVFWLTNRHKRAHDMTMDAALALHPTKVDGFDWLWERYITLVERYGDKLWGVIELDQGGAPRKRETRKRLHDEYGIRPIPVYHPLNDGWDYFDELAESTDRMCFGNIVQAKVPTRVRLVATAWERKQQYPHLWIHLLGYSLSPHLFAYPIESCDSSSWLSLLRWGQAKIDTSMHRAFGQPLVGLRYINDADTPEASHQRGIQLASCVSRMGLLNYRHHYLMLQEAIDNAA